MGQDMANTVDCYKGQFTAALGIERNFDSLRSAFVAAVPGSLPGDQIFAETKRAFDEDELPTVCAEVATTLNALCTEEDFHNWNYDHLEFIIEVAVRHRLRIPQNLLDCLPEYLAAAFKDGAQGDSGCE